VHILRIDIENFRAIRKAIVKPRRGRNVFVGPTGAGKTTLLEALRLLLSVEHAYPREDTFSWYDVHGLRRESGKAVRIGAILSLEDAEWIHFAELEEPLNLGLCAWEHDNEPQSIEAFDENGTMLRVALFYQWDREEPDDRIVAFLPKFAPPGHPECRKLTRKQREALGFWFAPLDQSLWEVASLSSRSKLTRAARDAGWDALGRHGVGSIIDQMVRLTEEHATEHWEQLSEIASPIHDGMQEIIPGLPGSDTLRLTAALTENWTQRVLELGLGSGQNPILPLRYEGTGIQRAFTVAAAEACSSPATDACIAGRALAIDEPEVGLHPQAQRSMMRKLTPSSVQSFVATHSPAILKACGAQDVWRLTSDNGNMKVNAPTLDSGAREAEHVLKNAERFWDLVSDGLFGRAVLLVEGPTEEGAIPVFDDWAVKTLEHYRGFDACDLTLVGCGGLPNIAPVARAFEAYGVRTIALHDFDNSNPADDENRRRRISDACTVTMHWPDRDCCRGLEDVLLAGTSPEVLRAVLSKWCELYDPSIKPFQHWLAEHLTTELKGAFCEDVGESDDDQAWIDVIAALWEHEDEAVRVRARDWFLGLCTGRQEGEGAIFAKSSRYSRIWAQCCVSQGSVPEGVRVLFRTLSQLMETCLCPKPAGRPQVLEWGTNESIEMEC